MIYRHSVFFEEPMDLSDFEEVPAEWRFITKDFADIQPRSVAEQDIAGDHQQTIVTHRVTVRWRPLYMQLRERLSRMRILCPTRGLLLHIKEAMFAEERTKHVVLECVEVHGNIPGERPGQLPAGA